MLKRILKKDIYDFRRIDDERLFLIPGRGGKCFEYNVNTNEIIYQTPTVYNVFDAMYSDDEKSIFTVNTSGQVFLVSKAENTIIEKSSCSYMYHCVNVFCLSNTFYFPHKNGRLKNISAFPPKETLLQPDFDIANVAKYYDTLYIMEGKKWNYSPYILLCSIENNEIVPKNNIPFPPEYRFDKQKLSFCKSKVVIELQSLAGVQPEYQWLVIDIQTHNSYILDLKYSYNRFKKLYGVQYACVIDWQFDFRTNRALFLANSMTHSSVFMVDLLTKEVINRIQSDNMVFANIYWVNDKKIYLSAGEGLFEWDLDQ